MQDRLGTLVASLTDKFHAAPSWEAFVRDIQGSSYLSSRLDNLQHPAADLLKQMRDEGVPVPMDTSSWTPKHKDDCVAYGCHKSAEMHKEFIREEMADFIKKGFQVVLPYSIAKDLPDSAYSPLGTKEERDRRARLVVDHSWFLINELTKAYLYPEVMQFGGTLPRLLYRVRHSNPRYGIVYTIKLDLADGFYQLQLKPSDAAKLSVVLPSYPGEPQLIAIPLVCTMGWQNSPPTFCSASETVADIANSTSYRHHVAPHRLESIAKELDESVPFGPSTEPPVSCAPTLVPSRVTSHPASNGPTVSPSDAPTTSERPPATSECSPGATFQDAQEFLPSQSTKTLCSELVPLPPSQPQPEDRVSLQPLSKPLAYTDVFVDDFIGLVQGSQRCRKAFRRNLLHTIDKAFAQPTDKEPNRQEAASVKKLKRGDGALTTQKLILGWILDTLRKTLELAEHCPAILASLFDKVRGCKRISQKRWESIIGQLRFMSLAMPGSSGLLSALQVGLKHSDKGRIKLTPHIHAYLQDFECIALSLATRSTRLAELIPEY